MSLCPDRTPRLQILVGGLITRVYTGLWTLKTPLIFLVLLAFQASSLQYEMLLLTDSISKEDSCWELRLRCGELGTIGWALFRKQKGATPAPRREERWEPLGSLAGAGGPCVLIVTPVRSQHSAFSSWL